MTLKDAFEIEDTKSLGHVTLKQFEEILESVDLDFDRGTEIGLSMYRLIRVYGTRYVRQALKC